TQTTLMPDAAERIGDFSNVLNAFGQPVTIIDPTTGAPFPGNTIPANRISAQARPLLNFYPLPNFPQSAGYNYQVPIVSRSDQDDVLVRWNRALGRKDFITGNLAYRNTRAGGPNIFGFVDSTDSAGMNAGVNWRHVFNQRWNWSVGYTFSR